MRTVRQTSKRGEDWLRAYLRATDGTVDTAYARPSRNKRAAETFCRKMMADENGYDFRIIGKNSSFFTCAWMVDTKDGTNLRVETAFDSYVIKDVLPF